jgi:hypothetical protein
LREEHVDNAPSSPTAFLKIVFCDVSVALVATRSDMWAVVSGVAF